MPARIFGISWGLIIFAVIVAILVQKFGDKIPLLNKV